MLIPVANMHFSAEVLSILQKHGIMLLGQLPALHPNDVLKIPDFSREYYREVDDRLRNLNTGFGRAIELRDALTLEKPYTDIADMTARAETKVRAVYQIPAYIGAPKTSFDAIKLSVDQDSLLNVFATAVANDQRFANISRQDIDALALIAKRMFLPS